MKSARSMDRAWADESARIAEPWLGLLAEEKTPTEDVDLSRPPPQAGPQPTPSDGFELTLFQYRASVHSISHLVKVRGRHCINCSDALYLVLAGNEDVSL